jgi:hypothetical protein
MTFAVKPSPETKTLHGGLRQGGLRHGGLRQSGVRREVCRHGGLRQGRQERTDKNENVEQEPECCECM